MNEEMLEALNKWIDSMAYSKVPGTFGDFLDVEEVKKYLPEFIEKMLKDVK